MSTTVGVIGPEDSLKLILEVGSEFSNLNLNVFTYQEILEVEEIIMKNNDIKYWLFSGQAPYWYALEKELIEHNNSIFIPLMGSGLIRTLLHAVYHEGYSLNRISFDTYLEKEIKEVFEELQIELDYTNVLPYEGYMNEDSIVSFHEKEVNKKKVNLAVTCIQSVYRVLKKRGIPVLRVLPTRNVIRQTFNYLTQKVEIAQYLSSSIAIISLNISKEHQKNIESFSYKFKKELLHCEEQILSYAQSVNGSMVRMGDMLYFIFTTRGSLNEALNNDRSLHSWIDAFYNMTKFKVNAGMGYGETVFLAEKNSRLALKYSQDYGSMSLFLVNETGEVEGPMIGEGTPTFTQRSLNNSMFEDLKISPMQWSRVQSYLKTNSKYEVTANELSDWMHVTDRNARKILTELEKGGLAEVIGEEQPGPKGRPRKVYRIKLDE